MQTCISCVYIDYSNMNIVSVRNGLGWLGIMTNTTLKIGVYGTPVITIGKDYKNVNVSLTRTEI